MFEPKGTLSQRRLILEALAGVDYDSVVPYDHLADVLGGVPIATVQRTVNAAKRALEAQHGRSLEAVPNEGYRVIRPSEHLALAGRHQSKSRRALLRASSTVSATDVSQLTEAERAAVTLAGTALSLQLAYMRRNDIRVNRLEQLAVSTAVRQERSEDEIAELRERLATLEREAQ